MASQEAAIETQIALSKYTKRVVLKSVLGRTDGGVGLVGQRIVIGGWVKSAKEVRKEPMPPSPPAAVVEDEKVEAEQKEMTCTEVFQARLPVIRCILKAFGAAGSQVGKEPPTPSSVILQVSDGSSVDNNNSNSRMHKRHSNSNNRIAKVS
ncbi:hypothetical protein Ancab_022216 [Ancistrocladus abbreviatus]